MRTQAGSSARSIFTLAVLLLLGREVVAQELGAAFAIDLDQARALFAEAEALSDADAGKLWGRRLYGPILLVDPATRAVVANQRDKGKDLRPQGEGLFAGYLPESVSLGNTTTRWAGIHWSMVLWPLPGEASWRGALMMHECFHRIQPGLGIPLAVPENHHLDTAEGRLWLRLEWRALVEALGERAPLESDALRDALVFRAYRRSRFSDAATEERELELNEGLAEYTGIRLSGADAATQRRRAIGNLKQYDRIGAPLVRSFAYASGPAYGILLDEAKPRWQRRVGKRADYGVMLQRAIRFRVPKELEAEALERAGLYGVEALREEENERDRGRRDRVAEHRRRFVDGPALVLPLVGSVNFSFDPHRVHAIDGVGSLHMGFHLNAPWGVLNAPDGALMIDVEGGNRRVRVPAPGETAIEGNRLAGSGWTLTLDAGWKLTPGPRPGDLTVWPRE